MLLPACLRTPALRSGQRALGFINKSIKKIKNDPPAGGRANALQVSIIRLWQLMEIERANYLLTYKRIT